MWFSSRSAYRKAATAKCPAASSVRSRSGAVSRKTCTSLRPTSCSCSITPTGPFSTGSPASTRAGNSSCSSFQWWCWSTKEVKNPTRRSAASGGTISRRSIASAMLRRMASALVICSCSSINSSVGLTDPPVWPGWPSPGSLQAPCRARSEAWAARRHPGEHALDLRERAGPVEVRALRNFGRLVEPLDDHPGLGAAQRVARCVDAARAFLQRVVRLENPFDRRSELRRRGRNQQRSEGCVILAQPDRLRQRHAPAPLARLGQQDLLLQADVAQQAAAELPPRTFSAQLVESIVVRFHERGDRPGGLHRAPPVARTAPGRLWALRESGPGDH